MVVLRPAAAAEEQLSEQKLEKTQAALAANYRG
jgi:hypothetical protein